MRTVDNSSGLTRSPSAPASEESTVVHQNADILEEIGEFLKRHRMAATTFGLWMANSGQLVHAIRIGRKLRPRTIAVLRDRMAAYTDMQGLLDNSAYEHICATGVVSVDSNNRAIFATGKRINPAVFSRLVEDGLLIPNGDAMFGSISQTFRANEKE